MIVYQLLVLFNLKQNKFIKKKKKTKSIIFISHEHYKYSKNIKSNITKKELKLKDEIILFNKINLWGNTNLEDAKKYDQLLSFRRICVLDNKI